MKKNNNAILLQDKSKAAQSKTVEDDKSLVTDFVFTADDLKVSINATQFC